MAPLADHNKLRIKWTPTVVFFTWQMCCSPFAVLDQLASGQSLHRPHYFGHKRYRCIEKLSTSTVVKFSTLSNASFTDMIAISSLKY